MSHTFGLGGQFLTMLAANGVSDTDLRRIEQRGLAFEVVEAIKEIVARDRQRAIAAQTERARTLSTGVDKLESLSGVSFDMVDATFAETVQTLRDNQIKTLGQLSKASVIDLEGFGLAPWVVNYLDIALQALGLGLRLMEEEQ